MRMEMIDKVNLSVCANLV